MRRQYTTSETKEAVTLRKRAMKDGGQSLYLDYTVDGVRQREFLKMYLVPERTAIDRIQNQETLKTANAAKARRIVEIQNGAAGFRRRRGDGVLLADYMEERAAYYRKRGSASYAQTVLNCRAYCTAFHGGGVKLSQVTKDYIIGFIGFLNDSDLGDGTIYTYFNALVVVLNQAARDDLIGENPARRVDPGAKPRQKESTREFLTLEEVRSLMDAPCEDACLKSAFMFACFTGLRISDMRTLDWNEVVDVGEGRLQIQKVQVKTGKMVYVPISDNATRWMPARTDGPVFPDIPVTPTLERKLDRWARAAKIRKHVTFHVARHTYATLLLTYGADLYTVSQLLGHKNIQTTQIYGKIVDETKRRTVSLIPELK